MRLELVELFPSPSRVGNRKIVNFLNEIVQRILRLSWKGLIRWNLHEATLECTAVVRRVDPGTEDEHGTRRENHVYVEFR